MTFDNKILFCLLFLMLPFDLKSQKQIDFEEEISRKFENYCSAFPWEEIYIHTDRCRFIAGEELWFNVYLIDRQSNKPGNKSRLAYVELLNSENHPVIQKRILLEKGTGPGQFSLPDTLSTGYYTLRAYTNRMKNFLPGNCFMKELTVYNAISDQKLKGKSGSLAEVPFTQKIRSDVAVETDNHRTDSLIINILSDENFRSSNKYLSYIFIQTHGKINLVKKINLISAVTRISLSKTLLTSGVNQITLFDGNGKPLIEKHICTAPSEKHLLNISTPDSCGLRQKVLISLSQYGTKLTDFQASNLSISVTLPDDEDKFPGITDYMVFGTEFGILPYELRNRGLSELPAESVESFLSKARSSWIDWNRIITGTIPELKYLPEYEEHYLSGRLVTMSGSYSDNSRCLFLSMPGKNAIFRYSRTGKDGRFNFTIPVCSDVQDLIIQPEIVDETSAIRIEPSFSEEYNSFSENNRSEIEKPDYISKWSVNYQVRKIYETSSLGEPVSRGTELPVSRRFYGKPDLEIRLSDYIALPVMQEVFFELTPGVILKNKKSVYSMYIADPVDNRIFDKPPIMFFDGVVVNDPSVIAGLDPDKIEKIDAVKELYMVGDYLFFGIVSVISKAGDFSSVTLPDYAVRLKYKVTDPVRTFSSPDYSSADLKQSRIPDFRNTVFWDPSIKIHDGKAGIEFWSSDIPGNYIIDIQGVTKDDQLISLKKIIKVK